MTTPSLFVLVQDEFFGPAYPHAAPPAHRLPVIAVIESEDGTLVVFDGEAADHPGPHVIHMGSSFFVSLEC